MDLREIRLANLQRLVKNLFGGNVAEFARAIGKDRNQARFLLNPEKPGGRWLGEKQAHEIEDALKLPRYALDHSDSDLSGSSYGAKLYDMADSPTQDQVGKPMRAAEKVVQIRPPQSREVAPGYIRLERLDVQPSAGPGSVAEMAPDVLEHVDVLAEWARRQLGSTDPARIKILTCKGDSMMPTIERGDILFVDVHTHHLDAEGIFVLDWHGRLLLKRLVPKMDGRLEIRSDNAQGYESEYVTAADIDRLTICGKVVSWWTLRRG